MTQLLGSFGHVASTSNTGMAAVAAESWAAVMTSPPAPSSSRTPRDPTIVRLVIGAPAGDAISRRRLRPLFSARAGQDALESEFPSWHAYS